LKSKLHVNLDVDFNSKSLRALMLLHRFHEWTIHKDFGGNCPSIWNSTRRIFQENHRMDRSMDRIADVSEILISWCIITSLCSLRNVLLVQTGTEYRECVSVISEIKKYLFNLLALCQPGTLWYFCLGFFVCCFFVGYQNCTKKL